MGSAGRTCALVVVLGDADFRRAGRGTGALDHIAFRCNDFEAFRIKLDKMEVPYKHRVVPDFDLQQLFVDDPDGVTIELNFFTEEST